MAETESTTNEERKEHRIKRTKAGVGGGGSGNLSSIPIFMGP